jgi:hypothetical protein
VLLLWRYEVKDFSEHCVFFLFFVFFSMKTTPNNMISTHLESYKKGLQLLYHGKFDVLAVPPLFLQECGHSSGMKFGREAC